MLKVTVYAMTVAQETATMATGALYPERRSEAYPSTIEPNIAPRSTEVCRFALSVDE
jgi:hypothetical protein